MNAQTNIVAFPGATPLEPPPVAETIPPAPMRYSTARDIDLIEIATRLGIEKRAPITIVHHLRNLANHDGFPLPRTMRLWRGRAVSGPRLIVTGSIWHRYLVDQWFDNRDTPSARPARLAHEQARLRSDLAARATALACADRKDGSRKSAHA